MQIGNKYRQVADRARSGLGHLMCLSTIMCLWCGTAAKAQAPQSEAGAEASASEDAAQTQRWYPVQRFDVRYAQQIGGLPAVDQLRQTEVELGRTERGFVAPGAGQSTETIQLGAFEGPAAFSRGALNAITDAVAQRLRQQQVDNILVVPDPTDIAYATGRDLRRFGKGRLTIVAAVDGPAFAVSRFDLTYAQDHPQHPPLDALQDVQVQLYETPSGYVAWLPGQKPVVKRPADPEATPQQPEMYHVSAIQKVIEAMRDALIEQGLIGVFVAPRPGQIDVAGDGRDFRGENKNLLLVVVTGTVEEVRTLASGDRLPVEERLNNPVHERIRNRSPFQPSENETSGDLLRSEPLNDYIFRLSRHPGRRVDAALSAGPEGEGVTLDYLVAENRPLRLYAQLSNTGTEQTDDFRQRFGLIHNQLTNNDDILRFDYVTNSFDETNALIGSYEAPWGDSERLRWRIGGSWSEFTASDVGFFGEDFSGESWMARGELIYNIYQDAELFVDIYGGARWMNVEVDNEIINVDGQDDFFLPRIGARLEKQTDLASTFVDLGLEWNLDGVAGTDEDTLPRLGRTAPDDDWWALTWNASHSFFLEPLLNRQAWEDPDTPESSTLAHEIALRFSGQNAFGYRLIPQAEQVAGGLYTVRGYEESIVAGDDVYVGSVEYRFHLPRAFALEPQPRRLFDEPFRFAPQQVYGRPDWDLIFKAFTDVARVELNDRFSFEENETLWSAGLGVELQIKQNFNVRLDWGYVLEDLESRDVDEGSSRAHVVATFLY